MFPFRSYCGTRICWFYRSLPVFLTIIIFTCTAKKDFFSLICSPVQNCPPASQICTWSLSIYILENTQNKPTKTFKSHCLVLKIKTLLLVNNSFSSNLTNVSHLEKILFSIINKKPKPLKKSGEVWKQNNDPWDTFGTGLLSQWIPSSLQDKQGQSITVPASLPLLSWRGTKHKFINTHN